MSGPASADAALDAVVAWRLLSTALEPPSPDSVDQVVVLAGALAERDGGEDLVALADAFEGAGPGRLGADHHALFGGTVRLAPYEGSYEVDPFRQLRGLSDISGFYLAFGAGAHGPAGERADHAGCELEFLAYLGLRRLALLDEGREEEAGLCLEIEGTFLADHAGRWLPGFFDELAVQEDSPAYAALGAAGARLVRAELERRELAPHPLGARPRALEIENDSFECGAAGLVGPLVPGTDPPRDRRRKRRS